MLYSIDKKPDWNVFLNILQVHDDRTPMSEFGLR